MSTRFGRWTFDQEAFQLIHDNGVRRLDLYQCKGPLEIADFIFHLADKDPEEQTAEDIGNLVRAFRALFPVVRDWINGGLEKERAALRPPKLSAEERSRLH